MARKRYKTIAVESINYSFVPNHRATMEALARSRLSPREFRVVIVIMNQTDGYLRDEDTIHPRFFEERAAIPRNHLSHSLSRLIEWRVISRNKWTFKVNPPATWSAEAFEPDTATKVAENSEKQIRGAEALEPSKAEKSPKTAKKGKSPKAARKVAENGESLAENGEKQIRSKENLSIENLKKTPSGGLRKKRNPDPNPIFNEIFQEMRSYLGCPEKTLEDPIPSYGKEAQAIKRMLTRGFTREDILACWKGKVSQRGGEFVSMTWVNEDISRRKDSYGERQRQRGLREPGGDSKQRQPPVRSVTEEDLESGRARFDERLGHIVWADEERDKAGGSALPDLP